MRDRRKRETGNDTNSLLARLQTVMCLTHMELDGKFQSLSMIRKGTASVKAILVKDSSVKSGTKAS